MSHHLTPLLIAIGLRASAPAPTQTTEQRGRRDHPRSALPAAPEKAPDVAVVKRMVETINDFRVNENRPRVTVNPQLTAAATRFAADMAKEGRVKKG